MAYTREQMRVYSRERYHRIRRECLEILGGRCVICGSEHSLEIDHIERDEKKFSIGKLLNYRLNVLIDELMKCQLLCKECHIKKSVEERGFTFHKVLHGTSGSYRYCKCRLCKDAHNTETREYKRRVRLRNRSLVQ